MDERQLGVIQRFGPAMLEGIPKALTRRLMQANSGVGILEISRRVAAFIKTVRLALDNSFASSTSPDWE
jgi:hypothetical protein